MMSRTLLVVERKTNLTLKDPVAKLLVNRFGSEINESGLDYLYGLIDGLPNLHKDDRIVLSNIISRIEEGASFELCDEY